MLLSRETASDRVQRLWRDARRTVSRSRSSHYGQSEAFALAATDVAGWRDRILVVETNRAYLARSCEHTESEVRALRRVARTSVNAARFEIRSESARVISEHSAVMTRADS